MFKFWTGTEMLNEGFFINSDGTVWSWVDFRMEDSFVQKGVLIRYCGVTDGNGAKVYEGDYYYTDDGLMEVFFIDGKFILMWADTGTYYCDLFDVIKALSRCGNKYENPELLNQ